MTFDNVKDMLLMAMSGILGTVIISLFRKLVDSVEELNVKIAQVLERLDGHEKRITHIEEKI